MSDDNFKIPGSLITAIKDKPIVPFVGAGVSMSVKKKNPDGTKSDESLFPSWKGFVEILATALKDDNKPEEADYILSSIKIKKPKYLEAMQHAQQELGAGDWYRIFEESFDKSKEEAHEESLKLPELIWKLSKNLIVTTNVDRVFEWTCPNPSEIKILDVQNVEYAQLQRDHAPKRPTVWHLHGSVDHKEKVVFTVDQYKAFYEEKDNEAKLQTLISHLTQHTFLFIGFSLDDAYIRQQLEYIHKIYKGGADSFYILFRERDIPTANFPDYVTPVPFSDFGKPLEDSVEELARITNSGDEVKALPPELVNPKELLKTHFNVPFASKGEGFIGRVGKVGEIWEALNKDSRAAISQAVAIEGFGGLGKTQLAVEYAHAYRDKYDNGVFWLTADEDMSVQLIKIGEALHWISQSNTGFDQAELVRNRFRKLSDCLIIFDNVDDQNAIKDYLPEVDFHPHILVTSRDEQHGFHPINLDTLSESESRELLTQIANRLPQSAEEEKALENILKELDGLPLAVELVGGYLLRRKNITFQDYFEYLEKEPIDRIEEKLPNNPFSKRDKSIIRALKISERLLNETDYLEEILDILAWSGKSSMSYSLLQDLVGTTDKLALKNALGVALELHFIKKEENQERYAIHRLLAKVRQFEKPLKVRKDWHQKIVLRMVEWFRKRKDEFEYLKEFEAEIIHLSQWQAQSSGVFPVEIVYLTDFEAYPLWHRGNYRESGELLENALNLYQQNKLIDEKLLSNLYNDLGVIEGNLGNIRHSFEFQQKALSTGRNIFEEKSEDIAKFLNNLGWTYGRLGNYPKALELQQQALEIHRELFGEKHSSIATSLNNLGSTYGQLGNYPKALELKEKALEIRRELFGEKHPDVATSLNDLGGTYEQLGNYPKALELQQQALEIYRELFGEKHPYVATSLNNLGIIYGQLGNYPKAIEFCEKSLQIQRELLGNQHPNTISSCKNLILGLVETGEREKAGRLAGEFLSYVPQNNRFRSFFEEYGAMYRKAKQKKKKRRR